MNKLNPQIVMDYVVNLGPFRQGNTEEDTGWSLTCIQRGCSYRNEYTVCTRNEDCLFANLKQEAILLAKAIKLDDSA
jgi:hypothetical protein